MWQGLFSRNSIYQILEKILKNLEILERIFSRIFSMSKIFKNLNSWKYALRELSISQHRLFYILHPSKYIQANVLASKWLPYCKVLTVNRYHNIDSAVHIPITYHSFHKKVVQSCFLVSFCLIILVLASSFTAGKSKTCLFLPRI